MKLIIAGGRDYENRDFIFKRIDILRNGFEVTEIVSGRGFKFDRDRRIYIGADFFGEEYAKERGLALKTMPADWDKHGKIAGPIRNCQMAKYANAAALFPGGKGTENMFKEAQKHGLMIFDYRAESPVPPTYNINPAFVKKTPPAPLGEEKGNNESR